MRFNDAGDPAGVERLGIASEPEADYELQPGGKGGCEDPRITFVEPLRRYLMTYTAFSVRGPRIALAISDTLPLEVPRARNSARIRASNSLTWMTKTPVCFPSPFLIHPAPRNGHPPPTAIPWYSAGGNRLPRRVP